MSVLARFADARIAALKVGLELTPEQEKNWPVFETAIRDISKARADRMASRGNEQPPADPVERLRQRSNALGTTAANLKKLADAEEPLYKSLDDAQKQRFRILAHVLRPHDQMRSAAWQGAAGSAMMVAVRTADHPAAGVIARSRAAPTPICKAAIQQIAARTSTSLSAAATEPPDTSPAACRSAGLRGPALFLFC
jgi:LTXXQ motif family protein